MIATEFYKKQVNDTELLIKTLQQKKSLFGILRIGTIALIIVAFYFLWHINIFATIALAIILLVIFVKLIHQDLANKAAIKHQQLLLAIYKDEILALDGVNKQFNDGKSLEPANHYYANDMDIFGSASLYQFTNRTTSEFGAEKLANWLLYPNNRNEILARQNAIKNLAEEITWCKNLQAIGKDTSIKKTTQYSINKWLQQPLEFLNFKHWKWLRYLLPLIVSAICTLYAFNKVSDNIFYLTLLIISIIGYQINKLVAPLHNQLSALVSDLQTLAQSLEQIENKTFTSPLLNELKQKLILNKTQASNTIKLLKAILDKLDLRYNIVLAVPLNLILFWSLQQVLNLEKWKVRNNQNINDWFDTLANFEALKSFATISFNNHDWCYPTLTDHYFEIHATQLGHPLIAKNKRVNNSINVENASSLMLITGSNMAGKSTYLRSVGVNAILCMAGAPVCASSFTMSPIQILSSMRVADNLEESTSTFYAELKKLKTIIEKINAGEQVFILLDEILRGTNSLDRHTGTEALIRQLIKQKTAAILATHDVELASLEKEYPSNILNHHFDAQINGDELYFDYKLKTGVCTNMNASILMKKIGLSV